LLKVIKVASDSFKVYLYFDWKVLINIIRLLLLFVNLLLICYYSVIIFCCIDIINLLLQFVMFRKVNKSVDFN